MVIVPHTKQRTSNYKQLLSGPVERGLYLGHSNERDSNYVMLENGCVCLAHTVRSIPMDLKWQITILETHRSADPTILVGAAYEDSGALPEPVSLDRIVANRAVGGTTKFGKLKKDEKERSREMFGPGSGGNGSAPYSALPKIIINNNIPSRDDLQSRSRKIIDLDEEVSPKSPKLPIPKRVISLDSSDEENDDTNGNKNEDPQENMEIDATPLQNNINNDDRTIIINVDNAY